MRIARWIHQGRARGVTVAAVVAHGQAMLDNSTVPDAMGEIFDGDVFFEADDGQCYTLAAVLTAVPVPPPVSPETRDV